MKARSRLQAASITVALEKIEQDLGLISVYPEMSISTGHRAFASSYGQFKIVCGTQLNRGCDSSSDEVGRYSYSR